MTVSANPYNAFCLSNNTATTILNQIRPAASIRTASFLSRQQKSPQPIAHRKYGRRYRFLSSTPSSSSSSANLAEDSDNSNNINNAEKEGAEIAKFSAMDAQWWDPAHNPLIGMNVVRIQYIRSIVYGDSDDDSDDDAFADKSVLDIGCGGGLLCESMARLGARLVTGYDLSRPLLREARRHSDFALEESIAKRIRYVATLSSHNDDDGHDDNKYDIVCLLEVLEHVDDVDEVLRTAAARLKSPDGILFISTINRTWKSFALTIVGAEYVARALPIGTHDWNRYLSPSEIEDKVRRAGLEQVDVTGMIVQPPCFRNWRLDPKDTDVNWIGAYRLASAPSPSSPRQEEKQASNTE